MFKAGDRVRLKAWVTTPTIHGSEECFPQGAVGIVASNVRKLYGTPYVDLKCSGTKRDYLRAFVAVEDLELMPERQVHVVKDGKVYELRDTDKDRTTFDCPWCAFEGIECSQIPTIASCKNRRHNFQEVKSGKVVS